MGHQANTATQAIGRADGKLPNVSAAAGRKGFKAAAGQQNAVRGDDRQDRYGVRELTPGELERTRRDLATGLGLTTDDSPLRISLASHLDAVTAQLDRRGHSTQTGG